MQTEKVINAVFLKMNKSLFFHSTFGRITVFLNCCEMFHGYLH